MAEDDSGRRSRLRRMKMGRAEKLYYLEHRFMRDLFYSDDKDSLKKLSDWYYYRSIVDVFNRRDPEEPIILKDEDFTVTEGRLRGSNAVMLKVDMPEATESPLCRTIYMVCSDDHKEKLFATIERYKDDSFGLCAWLSSEQYVVFETDISYSRWGEKERIREIFGELPELEGKLAEINRKYGGQKHAVSG